MRENRQCALCARGTHSAAVCSRSRRDGQPAPPAFQSDLPRPPDCTSRTPSIGERGQGIGYGGYGTGDREQGTGGGCSGHPLGPASTKTLIDSAPLTGCTSRTLSKGARKGAISPCFSQAPELGSSIASLKSKTAPGKKRNCKPDGHNRHHTRKKQKCRYSTDNGYRECCTRYTHSYRSRHGKAWEGRGEQQVVYALTYWPSASAKWLAVRTKLVAHPGHPSKGGRGRGQAGEWGGGAYSLLLCPSLPQKNIGLHWIDHTSVTSLLHLRSKKFPSGGGGGL